MRLRKEEQKASHAHSASCKHDLAACSCSGKLITRLAQSGELRLHHQGCTAYQQRHPALHRRLRVSPHKHPSNHCGLIQRQLCVISENPRQIKPPLTYSRGMLKIEIMPYLLFILLLMMVHLTRSYTCIEENCDDCASCMPDGDCSSGSSSCSGDRCVCASGDICYSVGTFEISGSNTFYVPFPQCMGTQSMSLSFWSATSSIDPFCNGANLNVFWEDYNQYPIGIIPGAEAVDSATLNDLVPPAAGMNYGQASQLAFANQHDECSLNGQYALCCETPPPPVTATAVVAASANVATTTSVMTTALSTSTSTVASTTASTSASRVSYSLHNLPQLLSPHLHLSLLPRL